MNEADEQAARVPDTATDEVPIIYGNGFSLALSNADVSLVVNLDNIPQVRVPMSYTTIKTLKNAITDLVSRLEEATQHSIMTSDDVAKGLEKIKNA